MKSTLEGALVRLAQKHQHVPRVGAAEALSRSLNAMRTHLNMEVAFISEFVDDRRYFRYVDSADQQAIIRVGQSDPLEQSYCQRVVDGRLPELIVDACQNAEALTLPVTRELPVRAHLSVPIRLKSGKVFGTFCCFSSQADTSLTHRDLAMMRVLSEMLADQIEEDMQDRMEQTEIQTRLDLAMEPGNMRSVYQPIWDLARNQLVGFEALTRFSCAPQRTPDLWFLEAAAAGQGTAMEIRAIECALQAVSQMPEGIYIAVNASPQTVVSPELSRVLSNHPLVRVVLEITEHEEVDVALYNEIARITRPLRQAGLRVAVDDAGAGYACFKHILYLSPDVIKLDVSITRDIDSDFSRQALAAALVRFAESTRGRLVAEGVETAAEIETLRQLGVGLAQGYALAKPMPLDQALQLVQSPS